MRTVYEFSVKDRKGKEVSLKEYANKMLSEADPNYKESADIKWNFTKFLVNKKGQVVARFEPTTSFDVIAKAIEEWLQA